MNKLKDLDRRLANIEKLCESTLEIFSEELSSNFSSIGDDINDKKRLENEVRQIEYAREKIESGEMPEKNDAMMAIEDGAIGIIKHVLKEEVEAINEELQKLE